MNKKFYLGLVATVGLFASCSSDDLTAEAPNGLSEVDGNQLVPIELAIGNIGSSSQTRGTGTVGDVQNSKWAGQKFNVYMFEQGTMTIAKDNDNVALYDNAVLTAPDQTAEGFDALDDAKKNIALLIETETEGATTTTTTSYRYFPNDAPYDFWGYRADDAAVGDPVVSDNDVKVTVNINGSQDIMVAKAAPKAAAENATKDNANNGEKLANGKIVGTYGGGKVEFDEAKLYSAYSARRQVNPTLNFKHLLSRLVFQVRASQASECDENTGIKVTAIEVESKTNGTLIAAYTAEEEPARLTFTGDPTFLSLKQRPSQVTAKAKGQWATINWAKDGDGVVTLSNNVKSWTAEQTGVAAYNKTFGLDDLCYTNDEKVLDEEYDNLPKYEGTKISDALADEANGSNGTLNVWCLFSAATYNNDVFKASDNLIALKPFTPVLGGGTDAYDSYEIVDATEEDYNADGATKVDGTPGDDDKVVGSIGKVWRSGDDPDYVYKKIVAVHHDAVGGTPANAQVGEALFVAPGEETYKLKFTVSQQVVTTVTKVGDAEPVPVPAPKTVTLTKLIKIPSGASGTNNNGDPLPSVAIAGKSYTIKLTVNGVNSVDLDNATMDDWDYTEGTDDIEIDDDDPNV